MPIGKILVILDDTMSSVKTLDFTLKHFNTGSNLITGLQLSHKLAAQEVQNGSSEFQSGFSELSFDQTDTLAQSLMEMKSVLEQRFKLIRLGTDELSSLYEQCVYADLLITSKRNFDDYVLPMLESKRNVLGHESSLSCLYLIAPDHVKNVEDIILINDNTGPSLHAIKGFCRLFSDLCKHSNTTLVNYIDNDLSDEENTKSLKLLATYLRAHCGAIAIHRYKGEDKEFLAKLLNVTDHSMVVMGSKTPVSEEQLFFNTTQILTIGGMI